MTTTTTVRFPRWRVAIAWLAIFAARFWWAVTVHQPTEREMRGVAAWCARFVAMSVRHKRCHGRSVFAILAALAFVGCASTAPPQQPAPDYSAWKCRESDTACALRAEAVIGHKTWCAEEGEDAEELDPMLTPCKSQVAFDPRPRISTGGEIALRLYYFFTLHWSEAFCCW